MKISIITINLNNLEGLQKTMQSVFSQNYEPIEYIIIDGGSTDGSKDYIKENEKKLAYWVSEKDSGPYYAMNKGIDRITGNYVLFLNSGDYFYNDNVIQDFANTQPTNDLVYGNVMLYDKGNFKAQKMASVFDAGVALTHTLNHQVVFFKSSLFDDKQRYNVNYKIVSDWIFIVDAVVKRGFSARHIDLIISVYDINGLSCDKNLRVEERQHYINSNFSKEFIRLLDAYRCTLHEKNNAKINRLKKLLLRLKRKLL